MAATLGTVHSRSQLMNSGGSVGHSVPVCADDQTGPQIRICEEAATARQRNSSTIASWRRHKHPRSRPSICKAILPGVLMPGSESLPYAPTTNT